VIISFAIAIPLAWFAMNKKNSNRQSGTPQKRSRLFEDGLHLTHLSADYFLDRFG
jgi:hypothetical protein